MYSAGEYTLCSSGHVLTVLGFLFSLSACGELEAGEIDFSSVAAIL